MWKRTALQRAIARHGRRAALALMVLVAYVCACAVGGMQLADLVLRPPRRVLTPTDAASAQAVAERTASRLSVESLVAADNTRLRAWWFVPVGRSRGSVIVLHGQADNRAAMLGLAELLLGDGYRVLAPDARAHGSSGGELATYGVRERHDLRMWADWAERRHPDQCLFAAGASMGGAILLQTLPDIPFCAAVTDSAFADFGDVARFRLGTELHLSDSLHGAVAGPVIASAMLYARLRYAIDLRAASPRDRVANARVPVLVVHGADDRQIPARDARALAAANPRSVRLWIVDGAPHSGAWATAPREYPARVLEFLAAHQ